MSERIKVFISWSGEPTKEFATSLQKWLRKVIQQCDPWVSPLIEAGARWTDEMFEQLRVSRAAIICVTPDNVAAPWINFEAGAISKQIGDRKQFVVPYLLGLEPHHVTGPLTLFQMKMATKADTFSLLQTINAATPTPVVDEDLQDLFNRFWPDLEKSVASIPASSTRPKAAASQEDMFAEILGRLRALEQTRPESVPGGRFQEQLSSRRRVLRLRHVIKERFSRIPNNAVDVDAMSDDDVLATDATIREKFGDWDNFVRFASTTAKPNDVTTPARIGDL